MKNYTLCKIFFDVFNKLQIEKSIVKMNIDEEALEKALEDYLLIMLGPSVKFNYDNYFPEIRKCFENIFSSEIFDKNISLIEHIKNCGQNFKERLSSLHYTSLFLEAVKRVYSDDYDGKLSFDNQINDGVIAINYIGNQLQIGKMVRKDKLALPFITIGDVDRFEVILKEFLDAVKRSDSFYNIFKMANFEDSQEDLLIKVLFEALLFNASVNDLGFIENYFVKLKAFIENEELKPLQKLYYVGEAFDDELYVMLKRSELEYETPYCLCFMLKKSQIELPIVRLGVKDNKAYILAVQSSQSDFINKDNKKKIEDYIKSIVPNSSKFRFYNPAHLVSILMSFGILKGLGITNVEVTEYLPLRHLKTSLERQMGEEEQDLYQQRLTDKNIYTYMRLISVVDGIKITDYPDLNVGLKLDISDNLTCNNYELLQLYNECLAFAKSLKNKETIR